MIPSGERANNDIVGKLKITNERGDDKKRIVNAKGSLNGREVDVQFQITGNLTNRELQKVLSDAFVGKTRQNHFGVKTTEFENKNVRGLKISVSYSDMGLASDLNAIKSSGKSLNNVFKKTDSITRQLFNKLNDVAKSAEEAKTSLSKTVKSARTTVEDKAGTAKDKARVLKDGVNRLYTDAKRVAKDTYDEVKGKLKTDKGSDYEYEFELEYQTEIIDQTKLEESGIKKTKQELQYDLIHDYFLKPENSKGKFIDFRENEFVIVDQKPKNCKEIGNQIRHFLDDRYQMTMDLLEEMEQSGNQDNLEETILQLGSNQALEAKVNDRSSDNPYAPSVSKRK